nr:reverse transcriptase domain-containing protein [Tanacetum cinerariifolium]
MLKFPMNGEIVTIRSTILMPTECTTIAATPKDQAKKAEARHKNFKVAIHPDFPDQEITIGETVSIKARMELSTLLKRNLDIFAWQPSDMTGVPRSIIEHRLNIREGYSPVRQKKRGQAPKPKRLRRYFQTYPIVVITDQPIKQVMSHPDILTDFLVEKPDDAPPEASMIKTLQEPWKLFTDGSSCVDGSEYKELIAGLRIAAQIGVRNVHVSIDSAKQVLGTYVAKEENMVKYLEKAKSLISGFAKFSITQVPRSKNKKADVLSKITSASFAHLSKQVLVETHLTMIKSSHGDTSFSLTYGMEAIVPVEIRIPTYRTMVVDVIHNNEELWLNLDLLEERRECVAIHEAKAKLKMPKYYNTRVRGITFRHGDFVYRSNEASHAMDEGKLGLKWEGPYEVSEALRDGAHRVRSMDRTVLLRT